jgi:anaerobic selenocysteine-containing dehydrogenase
MDRRSFIKLTAVAGSSTALSNCSRPEQQLVRFLPDDYFVPGQATWHPSVCGVCAAGCGLTVRVMAADADVVRDGQAGVVTILAAKKLEGAPQHPVNRGGLCARGQAAVQLTYHPDRITQPLKRSGARGSGEYQAIAWDDALDEVVSRLDALGAAGNEQALAALACARGGHRAALLDRFLTRFGAAEAVRYELFGDEVLRRANAISFGRDQLPTVDLARAQYVVSFGADCLGAWNSPVSQSRDYGDMRQGRRDIRGRFVQVEARMSQTGANADEWVPARPGTEGMLALGLAHVILAEKLRPAKAGTRAGLAIAGWSDGLPAYAPEAVEAMTGVPAARVRRLARELAAAGSAVAIAGGPPLAQTNGLFTALAVNALSALLGAVDSPGGLFFTPLASSLAMKATSASSARLQALLASNPQVLLLLDGANPVFAAPPAWQVRQALERVPYIVSFGPFLDESSALADLILPDHTFLESWAEAAPESGSLVSVVGVAPPVMRPLHQTRATCDVLLELARRLAKPVDLPWQTFEELLSASIHALHPTTDGRDAWAEAQERGGWWGQLPKELLAAPIASSGGAPVEAQAPAFDGDPGEFPCHLLPYPSIALGDGATAHLPWLQEMPDPLTSAMWSSWVEINPGTAERLGVAMGDVVEVTSSQGRVRAGAYISPAIAPDVVAMPVGQGHEQFTRYATGRGASPVQLLAPMREPDTGALAWAATRVRLTRVAGADGRLILFAGGLREHLERGR